MAHGFVPNADAGEEAEGWSTEDGRQGLKMLPDEKRASVGVKQEGKLSITITR